MGLEVVATAVLLVHLSLSSFTISAAPLFWPQALPPHYHRMSPVEAPSHPPHHHHHHHPHPHLHPHPHPPTSSPVPTKSPTHAPVYPPLKAPTPAPVQTPTKPPTYAPHKPPVHPPTKPPTMAPTKPPMHPPTYPPSHSPAKPPTSPKPPRSLVAVQGVVFCKSCKYARVDTLLEAKPVLGAAVKLTCKNTKYKQVVLAKTDKNGYFYVEAPKTVTSFGAHKCTVSLVSSPLASCTKPSNLHFGLKGAALRPEKTFIANKVPYILYTVGPFAFVPKCH